jgi:hypothetical protein
MRKVVNVVITKSFNSSPEEVQAQALEVVLALTAKMGRTDEGVSSLFVAIASLVALPFI